MFPDAGGDLEVAATGDVAAGDAAWLVPPASGEANERCQCCGSKPVGALITITPPT